MREADDLRAELERLRKESKRPKAEAAADFEIVENDGGVVLAEAKSLKGGALRDLSDRLRRQEKAAGVIVGSVDDGRVYLVVNLDESLVGRGLDASKLVRDSAAHRRRRRGSAHAGRGRRQESRRIAQRTGSRQASDRCSAGVKVLALDYRPGRTGVAVWTRPARSHGRSASSRGCDR